MESYMKEGSWNDEIAVSQATRQQCANQNRLQEKSGIAFISCNKP
jgi:hypothetical protein